MKTHSSHASRPARRAFTLIELLVVIAIILILAGLLFAAGPAIMRAAKKSTEKTNVQNLRIAITEFYNEYGKYPIDPSLTGSDLMIGEGGDGTTSDMMSVLLAEDRGWNSGHRLNPKKIVFLNVRPAKGSNNAPRAGLAEDGNYYDLWGEEYMILIDGDYDEVIDSSDNDKFDYEDMEVTDSGVFRNLGGVLILSYGEDKEMGKKGNGRFRGSDDICSWF